MKILFVMSKHSGGGSEISALNATELLLEHGHEIAHFCFSSAEDGTGCKARHFYAPQSANQNDKLAVDWHSYSTSWHLGEAIREFKPDVVQFYCSEDMVFSRVMGEPKRLGVANILYVQYGWPICPIYNLLRKSDQEICDGVCSYESNPGESARTYRCVGTDEKSEILLNDFRNRVRNQWMKKNFHQVLCISDSMTQLVKKSEQFPVSAVSTHYPACRKDLRQIANPQFLSQFKKTYFLIVARLVPTKGIFQALEVFKRLPHIPLVIVGDGPSRAEIERYILDNDLHHIQLVRWREGKELYRYYEKAYALLIPSVWYEALGHVIVESFAHGRPAIGTNSGGIPELIRPGETGLLYEPKDTKTLEQHILRLWENPELTRSMGEKARQTFQRLFDPETTYRDLMNHYENALDTAQFERQAPPVSLSDVKMPRELPPVVLVAFKRADTLKKVLEGLASQTVLPERILAYVDAPRNEEERLKVEACCDLLSQFQPLKITVNRRSHNLGCAKNVLESVSEALKEYPRAVVLEDDLVPAPAFYETMCKLLATYESFQKIFGVTGFSPRFFSHVDMPHDDIREDFFFSNSFGCWGWATWADRWNRIAEKVLKGETPYRGVLDLPLYEHLPHLPHIYHNRRKGRNDEWFHLVSYHCFYEGTLMVCPKKSLVYNAGCGHEDATNMQDGRMTESLINRYYDAQSRPNILPPAMRVHPVLTKRCHGRQRWEYLLNEFFYRVMSSWLERRLGKKNFESAKSKYEKLKSKKGYYWLVTLPKRVFAELLAGALSAPARRPVRQDTPSTRS